MIRTIQRDRAVRLNPPPTNLAGLGCQQQQQPCMCGKHGRGMRGLGSIDLSSIGLGDVDITIVLLVAALGFIVVQNVFFSDSKKEKRRQLREARDSFDRRVQQIKGTGKAKAKGKK